MAEASYDVVILGAGLTGSTLALVLARQGMRVLIVDKAPHPRFALGESLLKPTVLWMRVLAARFGVPELDVVAHLDRIHAQIAPTSGVKKAFGFVRHAAGRADTVAQWWANIALNYGEDVLEAHLFRQDVDAWLHAQAVAAGCTSLVGSVTGEAPAMADDTLCLETTAGRVRTRYVVDCAGQAPEVARLARLHDRHYPLRTRSRAIFTHLAGVRPFDLAAAAPDAALPWHQGTLHHLLDGAWMWVIPFDNHPRSSNGLVSVGVNFALARHPCTGQAPEAEWRALLARYPALAAQFGDAVAVRPWVSTGPLQRAAASVVGERCFLLGQAACNVDALYSRGLLNTMQSLYLLAELLLEARAGTAWRADDFAPLDSLHHSLLRVHDGLVHGSYAGFDHLPTTHWWLALWSQVERLSLSHVAAPFAAVLRGDPALRDTALADLRRGVCIAAQDETLTVIEAAGALMDETVLDERGAAALAARLETLAAPLVPLGFDSGRFVELTTRHGFSRTARRLLGAEHDLTAAIEIVDTHGGLAARLRDQPTVNALIRMLALRHARGHGVELAGDELGAALRAALGQVALPEFVLAHGGAINGVLERAALHTLAACSATDLARQWPQPAEVLLDCRVAGRYVGLRWRPAADALPAMLVLITMDARQTYIVTLQGHGDAADLLLAQMPERTDYQYSCQASS